MALTLHLSLHCKTTSLNLLRSSAMKALQKVATLAAKEVAQAAKEVALVAKVVALVAK